MYTLTRQSRNFKLKSLMVLSSIISILLFSTSCTNEQVSSSPVQKTSDEDSSFEENGNIFFSFRPNGKKSKPLKAVYNQKQNIVTIISLPTRLKVLINGQISSDHGGIAKDLSLKKGCQDIRRTYRNSIRNKTPFEKGDELNKTSNPLSLTAPSLEITNQMQKAIFSRIKFPVGRPLPKIEFPDFELIYKKRSTTFKKFYPAEDQAYEESIDKMARGEERKLSFALICDLITGYIKITANFQDKEKSTVKVNISWY